MSIQPTNTNSALYLFPVNISDAPLDQILPAGNIALLRDIKFFIVENIRTARRFLKRCDRNIDINAITFYELNNHTRHEEIHSFLDPLRQGNDMGIMSEAGCPAIADPGAAVVEIAQREGRKVVPLVGPSSILMALMASGFNGQGFSFHGYLPIDSRERLSALRKLESDSKRNDMTQIFIETPYRNTKMLHFLVENLSPGTRICIARDITDPNKEMIVSRPAAEWKGVQMELDKHPAIFLIYHS